MGKLSENIVLIALEKFNQLGIRAVTVDDICKELRISKKTFYNEFNNKLELVRAVLEYYKRMNSKCFSDFDSEKNAIEILIEIIKNIKKKVDKEPFRFYYDLEKYYPDIFDAHREEQQLLMKEEFEKNLRRGMAEGYYRGDLDVEMISLFHSLQKNTIVAMLQSDMKISRKRMMDFYIDLTVRLIVNEKGLKYIQENIID